MSEPVIFFGSGPVAAKALGLLNKDFEIEAVVTKPQPEHHKEAFPVLKVSQELGLTTLPVSDKVGLSTLFGQKPAKSRVGVVIDFGIIISRDVIDYFPFGIVNSHFSLLPEWRGADPISFAILSGQQETGVSIMLIVEKLDEGSLLAQRPHPITQDATTPSLTAKLINLSHELLVDTLPGYLNGTVRPYSQDLSKLPTYSRKLTKADGNIDWNKPAEQIEREVRAFQGWPSSYTVLSGKEVKILAAEVVKYQSQSPGMVCNVAGELHVECGQDSFKILKVQVAGKNPITGAEFVRGYLDKGSRSDK